MTFSDYVIESPQHNFRPMVGTYTRIACHYSEICLRIECYENSLIALMQGALSTVILWKARNMFECILNLELVQPVSRKVAFAIADNSAQFFWALRPINTLGMELRPKKSEDVYYTSSRVIH